MTNTSITKKYIINGPFNIIRLSNNNKILYILGDFHHPFNQQTECLYNDNYESKDIDKFILLFMKNNKDKPVDLFVESKNIEFKPNQYNNKEIYINSIQKLYQHYLVKNKTDIMINKKYPNFRFHYSDIRNQLLNNWYIVMFYDNNIKNKNINNLNIPVLYKYLKNLIEETLESINNSSIINKILNRYSHEDIKIKINNIYDKYIFKNFEYVLKKINNLIINYSELTESLIIREIIKINDICQIIFLCITDLFFMRRLLDKNYIQTCILYTGNNHLINISYLLVKYFNFKISHIYNFSNVDKINNLILNNQFKNFNYINEINNTLGINYTTIIQCSNLFDFPDNFD